MAKLADLFIKLGLKKDGFDKGIDQAKSKTNAFSSSIKKIGGYLAGAFAVERVLAFGKELLQLGGIAEGVEAAFQRIGGMRYLDDLKDATKGTVSELELMKRAVMASNFQIPIENLADLFKFATKRAQETGESVDYLVSSIVLGIGRKSPLILDNLGISAVRLRQELKGAGVELNTVQDIAAAVGRIAAEEMQKSGDIIETNAIKLQSLTASWEDFKKTLATDPSVQTFMGRLLMEAQDFINLTTKFQTTKQVKEQEQAERDLAKKREENTKAQIELNNLFGKSINDLTEEQIQAAIKESEAANAAYEANKAKGKTLGELKAETDALKKSLDDYGINQQTEIQNTLKQIYANEKLINSLTKLKRTSDADVPNLMESLGLSGNEFSTQLPDTSALANMDSFIQSVRDKLANMIDEETMQKMIDNFKKFEQVSMELTSALKSGLVSAFNEIGTSIGEALTGGSWSDFGKALLDTIGKFMQMLGGAIIAIGVGLLNLEAGLASLNPALIIAGGTAMVAAGALVSSIAGGGLKGASASASGYNASGSSASTAISGNVSFVLEGDKLVGAINNNSAKRRLTR